MAAPAVVMLTGCIVCTCSNIAMGWELDAITMVILGGLAIDGDFGLGTVNVSGIVMPMPVGILLIAAMILPSYVS